MVHVDYFEASPGADRTEIWSQRARDAGLAQELEEAQKSQGEPANEQRYQVGRRK